MVVCMQQGADLHMAQLMPLPLTFSCFSKIQIGFTFWYRLTRVVLDKGPINGCVCVCVCARSCLWNYTSHLHQIFVHVTYGRGSVLLWRRSDTLYTSGFMDDVIFAHKPRLLDVAAQLKRSAHAALGLAINHLLACNFAKYSLI